MATLLHHLTFLSFFRRPGGQDIVDLRTADCLSGNQRRFIFILIVGTTYVNVWSEELLLLNSHLPTVL
jgi:hypothetical protein